uniref:C2H2-type domain-containing protein n=1 Tax=Trichogramma kaykai TaxID=54128 RepID=A0ABD2WU49_9HYME
MYKLDIFDRRLLTLYFIVCTTNACGCYLPLDELVNARRTRHRIDRSRPLMVCQSCGRTYTHRHNLLKHMKHECGGQRHYSCHICHIRFTQKSSVKRHLAFKHLSGV